MTGDKTYQGWTNFETWGAALILDNDQGTYSEVRENLAQIKGEAPGDEAVARGTWSIDDTIRYRFADWLKDYIEQLCGFDGEELGLAEPTPMASQLLRGALSDVDYDEIAANIIGESSEVSSA